MNSSSMSCREGRKVPDSVNSQSHSSSMEKRIELDTERRIYLFCTKQSGGREAVYSQRTINGLLLRHSQVCLCKRDRDAGLGGAYRRPLLRRNCVTIAQTVHTFARFAPTHPGDWAPGIHALIKRHLQRACKT